MLANYIEFADALDLLRAGDEGPDAAAALQILAETVLMHRASLGKKG